MIPALRIDLLDSNEYRAPIRDGRVLLGEAHQPTIANVIGEAARLYQPAPQAFNIYYGPVSVGTIIRDRMMYDAETYAHRLVVLEALLA